MNPYRDPEPITVEQITAAFNTVALAADKIPFNSAGFAYLANSMHRTLGVPVAVEPHSAAWSIAVRVHPGEAYEQRFVQNVLARFRFEVA